MKTLIRGVQDFKYITKDNKEFFDLEEAVEYENSLVKFTPKKAVPYEFITSIQQAINMAVEENRVVRFLWKGTNESIKKGIDFKRDCRLLKPDKDSNDVAIVPPSVKDFDFDEVE
jgi:hypothetical protein